MDADFTNCETKQSHG